LSDEVLQRSENGLADATAMPSILPSLIPEWFTFLMPAYPVCLGKEAVNERFWFTAK